MTVAIQALTKGPSSSIGQSHQTIAPSQSVPAEPQSELNPAKKSEYETRMLRSIESHKISTPMALRKEILTQLDIDYVSSKLDFAVGYMKGGTKLWIRTASDIQDAWSFVHRGEHISLS